jgi:hypothetical protein
VLDVKGKRRSPPIALHRPAERGRSPLTDAIT